MTEDQIANIDILSDAVKSINNCLQCRICLDTISSPFKTRCGHSFCRTCIGTVLSKKNSRCPLCNTNLQRRSISKDNHIEKCIKSFQKLLNSIQDDVNIDILNHRKNPRNTKEGHGTPDAKRHNTSCIQNTKEKKRKLENENNFLSLTKEIASVKPPACFSSRQDIAEQKNVTNKTVKKKDYTEKRKECKDSSTDEMSGVYPLLSSPQQLKISTSEEIVLTKDKRIKSWLETLPNTEQFEHPNRSPKLLANYCLDDTASVGSGVSLMSSVSNIKKEKDSYISDHSNNTDEEPSNSMKPIQISSNNAGGKNNKKSATAMTTRSFLEKEIKPDSTEFKLKYEAIHARVRQLSTKVVNKNPIENLNDPTNSINKQKQLGPSSTTKETWNRVVRIGKEMRSKKKKLKSLDISKQSTNVTRDRKLSITSIQIDKFDREKNKELINIDDDDQDENIIECNSTSDNSEGKVEQKSLKNTSFISLEKEGRVPIQSLCREQMDDIIGITTNINQSKNDQESKDNHSSNCEDQGTVPKKRLSLRKNNDSKDSSNISNTDQSPPPKITPVKVNLEEHYNILRDSPPFLSPVNKHTTIPIQANENSRINESISRLSLKKNQTINVKSKEVTVIPEIAQLPSVKCDLTEQINQDISFQDLSKNVNEIIDNKISKSTGSNDSNRTNTNNLMSNNKKIFVVPFNKLGKVFKKKRKVKFYKLGPVRNESTMSPLTITGLSISKVNMITWEESDDSSDTNGIEQECNLLDNRKPVTSLIVDQDITNNQIYSIKNKCTESSSRKETQDSLDVLLISLKEPTNENTVNVNDQHKIVKSLSRKNLENLSTKGTSSKPTITSIVKMIPQEEDSQLKYLNTESILDQMSAKLKISNESKDSRLKRKSERKIDDSKFGQIINDEKRMLIGYNANTITKNREIKESSDDDSNNSELANNLTQIDRLNINEIREDANTIISINSESDNNTDNNKITTNPLNESKTKYKRIMIAHSSTDSNESQMRKRKFDIIDNKNNKKVKMNNKTGVDSEDTDDDNLVNEIVNNWCNDLDTSMKPIKTSKSIESNNTKAMVIIPQSINFDTWNNDYTAPNFIPEKKESERSNNDIIDKVKMIRMDENNMIEGINNVNEVETITDSLGRNFFTEENIINDNDRFENEDKKDMLPLSNSSYVETNDLFAEFNETKIENNFEDRLIKNFNGFNKENETSVYMVNNKNDITGKKNIMIKQRKENNKRTTTAMAAATAAATAGTTTTTMTTLISEKRKYEDFSKSKDQLIEQKETSFEYDSLLDVTQDQLLLKALEEDLFGAANSRSLGKSTNKKTLSEERRLESSFQTPTKSKKNLENAQNAEEISSDEDEIIENTPQSNNKFMEVDRSANNFKARKSLTMSQTTTTTPTTTSSKKFQQVGEGTMTKIAITTPTNTTTATPPYFSVAVKVKTPIDQNKILPIYQSTPKVVNQQIAFNRDAEPNRFRENKKSFESSKVNTKNQEFEESRMIKKMETKVNNNKRLCFVWSSLMSNQIDSIKKFARLINATCTQNFNSTVTHVIVGTNDENNAATKTLKFLQGIAYRKFVVSFKWILECLKEGTLINEEPYEAVDCYTLEPGPRKSRLRENDLLDGFAFICIEPFQNITIIEFEDLLRAMGGIIVPSMDALASIKNKHKVILIQSDIHTDEIVENWYIKTSAIPVSCDWIVECISQYKLVSCYTHLHEVVQEDILKLGYPEQMLESEELSSCTLGDC